MNVLLGVTGSIASTLTQKLKVQLGLSGHSIKTVVTLSALEFKEPSDAWGDFYIDYDEWESYRNEQKVLHIDLVKWADVFLIAPATANTLTKIKLKLSDNLLTNCALAWNYEKPFIVAPAMNTQMWKNIGELSFFNGTDMKVIEPKEKTLYCGDTGLGAMAEISDIVGIVNSFSRRVRPEIT